MSNDKLRDLTVVDIVYSDGERPTAQKLEGGEVQTRKALEYLEATLGDAFGESLQTNPVYISNFARDIGDRSQLNPVILSDIFIDDYQQDLIAGKNEHELDLIPIGTGSSIITQSNDGSVVVGQFKNTVEELEQVGDWTILPGLYEAGLTKNSRKLITHAPSTGGSVIFTKVTSGRGSAGTDARHNVIPSIAQAENNGDFIEITELDALNHIYSFKLPKERYTVNRTYEGTISSLSNTVAGLGSDQQLKLPKWLFDPLGLNLGDLTAGQQDFPLNVIRIYDWTEKRIVSDLIRVQTSPTPTNREFEIICTFKTPIYDYTNKKYMIVTSGTSLSDLIGVMQRDLYFHRHMGDDMIRGIKHSDLFGLRTGDTDITERSKYYGPSSIDNNDHSQYLHRNGFTSSDIGGGANIFRGTLLIGNTETGPETEHENYNLSSDSYPIAFGKISNGGQLYFDKIRKHNLPEGRGNIPVNFSDPALIIEGALDDTTSSLKTVYCDSNFRVDGDTVLGTNDDHDVLIPGDLYTRNSITLTPRVSSGLNPETGKFFYDSSENAYMYWNGNAWINMSTGSNEIYVGDGVVSFGKYNGATATPIQSAIDEAATHGGTVRVLRGTYDCGGTTIILANNVTIKGEFGATVIKSAGTCFYISSSISNAKIIDLKIENSSTGINNHGINTVIDSIIFHNTSTAIALNSSRAKIGLNDYIGVTQKISHNIDMHSEQTRVEHVGFSSELYMIDPVDKSKEFDNWVRTGGSGQIGFEDSTDSMIGRGRWKITGTGTFELNKFIPVMPAAGIGAYIGAKDTSTSTIYVGITAYNSSYSPIGTRYFLLNGYVGLNGGWQYYQDICVQEGTGLHDFPAGTRFVKPRIYISSNGGTVYFDGFNIFPMNFSTISLYS